MVAMDQFTTSEGRAEFRFNVEREQVFDRMAPQWDSIAPQIPLENIRELIAIADVKGKTVLDVGAGTGILVAEGLAASPEQWIACDLSSSMLKILEAKFKNAAVEQQLAVLHADVHDLPLKSASVDRVICHNVFPHFQLPKTALAELFRVLCPGGLLVINHFPGRELINRVHRSAPHAILRMDLLVPAEEAVEWLKEVGFAVTEVIDSQQLYRIMAVRPTGGD